MTLILVIHYKQTQNKQMTYKSKFEASEHRAHYQNIATKILKEMSVLRSLVENSPIAPRRWIWELIQNAKDVHSQGGVKIKIEQWTDIDDSEYISFMHNGKPFTADNIRFLIEQISTKDRSKDDEGKRKTTGKFGTGFLTTHLLSETVTVKGVAKEPELDFVKFKLELDRTGFEIEEITDAVQTAKESVQNLDESPPYDRYVEGNFNTEFSYPLKDSVSLRVAKAGLDDLEICLPYTLAFVKEIESIEVKSNNQYYHNSNVTEKISEDISLVTILMQDTIDQSLTNYEMVFLSKGFTTIALPVKREDHIITVLPINNKTPRLFCDFPLIGAERFHFPVVINNPNFNPTDPRDGVFLTTSERANRLVDENKKIINEAIELYETLLDYAVENKWKELHLLAQISPVSESVEWIDENWFKKEVLIPIRIDLLYADIVTNSNNELTSILDLKEKKNVYFPSSGTKEIRNKIWRLANYWFPHRLPQESDVELWNKLIWHECGKLDLNQFAEFTASLKTVDELASRLKGIDVYEWLNEFYKVLALDESEYDSIIYKYEIFPNQNGILCKLSRLKNDNGDIGDNFKDILKSLGNDIRDELLHEDIIFDLGDENIMDLNYVVKEINSEVQQKASDREVAKSYGGAFKKLLLWFKEKPEKAKSLFPNLYKNKHLLYDDDEILDNIEKAEQLSDMLNEFAVSSIDELRELIKQSNSGNNISGELLPVTQELLLNMGISSPEEWAEAIKDKNLAELFSHESTPTTDMFFYVQGLIEQAKTNIIQHLKNLDNYDLTNLDDTTAPTILAGIQKDKREISIVIRPAYNGQVIVYYGSEKDILDYEDSELWIDDGFVPRKITLGHILKKAKIVKFPI